jgi:putative transposase
MSRYRRAKAASTFFFTVVSYQRRPILCDVMLRTALHRAIDNVRSQRPFKIDAWVLLPDHLHCIWTMPDGDADFSTRWRLIKRWVAISCRHAYRDDYPASRSRRTHSDSTIWQRRFWEHQIRNEDDFERHADYIHFNPVRHGYVDRVIDWPYSTFHRHVGAGIYPHDWVGAPTLYELDFE